MKLVPAGATIEELQKKAAACEEQAKCEPESEATKLKQEALLCREWDLCPQFWKMALLAKPNQTPWLQVNE